MEKKERKKIKKKHTLQLTIKPLQEQEQTVRLKMTLVMLMRQEILRIIETDRQTGQDRTGPIR